MANTKKNIGEQGIPGGGSDFGIGYIAIPSDIDREKYVKESLRTGRVCMFTNYMEFYRNVRIGKITSQFIEFPDNFEEMGSMVAWRKEPFHNQPIIVDVYKNLDEVSDQEEGEFDFFKETEDASVNIAGRAKDGSIYIDVDSSLEEGGTLNISVLNGNDSANINVFTKGQINLESVGKINAKVTDEWNVEVSEPDSEDKTTIQAIKSETNIQSPKIVHNKGNEAMVKGDTLKNDILDELIDLLLQATTPTSIGTQPLANILPQLNKLKQQTQTILSKKSNLE